jgi:hypothetical protein
VLTYQSNRPLTSAVSHPFSCTFSAGIWKDRLIAKARASPGRIIFPTKNKADIKGTTTIPLPPVKNPFTPSFPPSVLPTIHPIPSVLTPGLVYMCSGMSDDEIAAVAGCDLLNEAPEIRNWLLDVEKGKELIVGGTAHTS